MQKIIIDDVDKNNSLFRFDVRNKEYIDINGFPATIGQDSINAEDTKKVFFSKGVKGILNLIDVWLIWRMHKDHYLDKDWHNEFLSEEYLYDIEKLIITFNNMKEWLKDRKYYLVELNKDIDYKEDDIDEAKQSVINDKNRGFNIRYLYAKEMYKGKTNNFDDIKVEPWNMHTITGKGINPDKISLVITKEGKEDALSIIEYLYLNYQNKNEFRLLVLFIEYINKNNIEIKRNIKK